MLKKIWKALDGNFTLFLLVVMCGGIYLFFTRPSVAGKDDLTVISGTLKNISQVLGSGNKLIKTESAPAYHIHLNEYPSKFEASYAFYDGKELYMTSRAGDRIQMHIAKEDEGYLERPDHRIRSFSLKVNGVKFLSVDRSLSGFGAGWFELAMIFIPLAIVSIIVIRSIKEQNSTVRLGKK